MREAGLLFISLGIMAMTALDGETTHTVGLGAWWLGMVLLVDALLGLDGRPAQYLWGIAFGGGCAVFLNSDLPHWLTEENGRLVVAILSFAVSVTLLIRRNRTPPST